MTAERPELNSDLESVERPLSEQFPVCTQPENFGGGNAPSIGAILFVVVSTLLYFWSDFASSWGLLLAIAAAAGGIVWILGLPAQQAQAGGSTHPDPDVRALIDKKITISEYRLRKEGSGGQGPTQK